MNRRTFLVAGLGALCVPVLVQAWPQKAFEAEKSDEVLSELAKNVPEHSDAITITAPDIAENGAVVPVSVSTSLEDVTRISILVEKNPLPLTSSYDLSSDSVPYVSTRVKMLKTSNVVALVDAGGKTYTGSREIKVTIGGCGG